MKKGRRPKYRRAMSGQMAVRMPESLRRKVIRQKKDCETVADAARRLIELGLDAQSKGGTATG